MSVRRCKYGSGKRWHQKSEQCRAPCSKKGPGWRRSSKGPYYKCEPPKRPVREGPRCSGGKRYHKLSNRCRTPCKSKYPAGTHRRSRKAPYYCVEKKKMSSSATKIQSAIRRSLAKKRAAALRGSSSKVPFFKKIADGTKRVAQNGIFETPSGTYRKTSAKTSVKVK